MTLAELANAVCTKVRHLEAEDVTNAKAFIRRWYQELFRLHLWKDSVAAYAATIDPDSTNAATAALAAEGILLLPGNVERVLAVRTMGAASSEIALRGRDLGTFWQLNPDAFSATGEPCEFVAMGALTGWNLTGATVVVTSSSVADVGKTVRVEYLDSEGERQSGSLTLAADTPGAGYTGASVGEAVEIFSLGSEGLTGTLTCSASVDGTLHTLATLVAGATAAPLRIPMYALPRATAAASYRLLVKRTPLAMIHDYEQVDVRGLESVVMDYACMDMAVAYPNKLYDPAMFRAQADAGRQALLAGEVLQSHANPRLMPCGGYGDELASDWLTR